MRLFFGEPFLYISVPPAGQGVEPQKSTNLNACNKSTCGVLIKSKLIQRQTTPL